jgi:hypothetical protein
MAVFCHIVGGVLSPILSSIYLDRLDRFVETRLLPAYNRGKRRKTNAPYVALTKAAWKKRIERKPGEAKARRKQAQRMPSRDPQDPNFRRLWYVRYADDWLLGFSGPRSEAEQIKDQLNPFLRETLKLTLSYEKTLITNARTEPARFLGYHVVNQDADDKHYRALHRRSINGAPGLKIPEEVIRAKCAKYMRNGNPVHLPQRINDTEYSSVVQYQAEYRGFVQYYLRAYNVHRLWRLHRVMQLSLVHTLADKHRTSANRILEKLKTTRTTAHGTLKVLEVRHARGEGKPPLVARFGGIELRWQKKAILDEQPKEVFGKRSEVVQRLLAQECELCGTTEDCEVHHVRKLADLDKPGRREKPLWVKRMATRRRKTLVTCRKCHEEIHRERPSRHTVAG